MKKLFTLPAIVLISLLPTLSTTAQNHRYTTYNEYDYDLSEYLDLEAVASAFSFAENYQDFERRLNDEDNSVSNLDLNGDGYVDYLRLVKFMDNNYHVIMIQAVLGENYFQDVATILIDVRRYYRNAVQIIGESSLYGKNYIIEPVFGWEPPIMRWMRYSNVSRYVSPYYWNYYPRYYGFRSIMDLPFYFRHMNRYIDYNHRYHHSDRIRFSISLNLFDNYGRNDYWRDHRDHDFYNRHQDHNYKNKNDFNRPGRPTIEHNNQGYQTPGNNRPEDRNPGRNEGDRRDRPGNGYNNNNGNYQNRDASQGAGNRPNQDVKPRTDAGNERFRPQNPNTGNSGNRGNSEDFRKRETERATPRTEPARPTVRTEPSKPVIKSESTKTENTRSATPARDSDRSSSNRESGGRR